MTSCWACETELRPEWKFCIHCGVPVETDAELTARERARSPLALYGWIVGGIGAALVIALVVIFVLAQ